MAAFRASRLVCSAMSSMVSTTAPIFSPSLPSSSTLPAAVATTCLISAMPATVSRTARAPCSAEACVCCEAAATLLGVAGDLLDAGRHLGGRG